MDVLWTTNRQFAFWNWKKFPSFSLVAYTGTQCDWHILFCPLGGPYDATKTWSSEFFFFCCCPPTAQRPMRSRQSITARLIIGLIRHDTDRYGTDPLPSAAIYRPKFCEHFIWPLHAHLMTCLLNFKLTYLKFK